jgi:DNA-binding response OmpR family regulator
MGKRVLVIDDDKAILEAVGSILKYEDYDVRTTVTPENINDDIDEFNPDLILLDINLGSFNGLQICRTLKGNPQTKSIPVIILSADDSIFDAIQIFGADDIILKPLDLNILLETVGKYLLAPVIQMNRNRSH